MTSEIRRVADLPELAAPSSEDDRQAVRRAWAALLPRIGQIADEITSELLSRAASEGSGGTPQEDADVRAATRKHVRAGVRTLAGIVGVDERAVDVWREFGRSQAQQDVPLERILNAYTVGNRVLWETLVCWHREGVVADHIDERTLLLAGRSLWNAMDVQNAVMIAAYRTESNRLQSRDDGRRARILDGLIDGRGSDVAFARDACQVLGIDTGTPVTCVVSLCNPLSDDLAPRPPGGLEARGLVAHWRSRGAQTVGLLVHPQHTVDEICTILRRHGIGRVAVMTSADGVEGFGAAYRLAARAAETLPYGVSSVTQVTDRLPQLLLAANQEVAHLLVEQVLGRVMAQPEHQREVLLDTLSAYLAGGLSPTRAAETLTCHRNTVIYRMHHMSELMPYDPHQPDDLLLITLALTAVQTARGARR